LTSDFVTLRDGPTLPVEALKLAWDLEDAGYTMRAVHGTLRLTPVRPGADELGPTDRASIVRWKPHLLAIVDYCASRSVESGLQ